VQFQPPATRLYASVPNEKNVMVENLSGEWVEAFPNKNAKAYLYFFVSVDCPICNSYVPEYNRLQAEYASKGVITRLVYPNADETIEAIRQHSREFNVQPEQVWDPNHTLVKAAGVTITPEAAIFVPGSGVVYRGRIDNRFARLGVTRPEATEHDLRQALNALLEGRPILKIQQKGVGCSIPLS
jgi:hypothetical protein